MPRSRETIAGGVCVDRHLHDRGYVALILKGGFEEAGDSGRFTAKPGDLLVHPPFDAHTDRMGSCETVILNFPWTRDCWGLGPRYLVSDLDEVVRAWEKNPNEAFELALDQVEAAVMTPLDWPDELAIALEANANLKLGKWAAARGLDRATITRGFRRLYGVTPAAYRCELRAKAAWRAIVNGVQPFTAIAIDAGFADQAHMVREVRALTGQPPGAWRRPVTFVQ